MKKLLFLLAAVLIATAQLYSQWVQQTSPTTNTLNNIHFLNSQTGYIAGSNGLILKTTNGGVNWVTQITPTILGVDNIYFFDANTGIAVCSNVTSVILKTTNGGTNWIIKYTNSQIELREPIHFINSNTGYTGGMTQNYLVDSSIIKTTNGGENWQKIKVNGVREVDKFSFTDANTGYAAAWGMDGYPCITKTTDGGVSWNKIYSYSSFTSTFMSTYFVNANTGWIVGINSINRSLIQKTTNAGVNWVDQVNQHPSNWELYDIQMLNENTGWIIGDVGQIVKTTNGGVNWRAQNSIALPLWGIEFNGADTGWVVGMGGLILKTVNGGGTVSVQNISSEVPSAYSLSQNYPNPFNPTTNIRYAIPRSGLVKLVVFDALGREVETLVNESQQAGTYEAKFNGASLTSGVYFYKLSAGDFTETKRMLLIK